MKVAPSPVPAWARFAFTAALALLLLTLGLSWNQPLLDQHDFRQTQTAISAYWMTGGGPLWLYESPLFGPPWLVPFEFPLYQWLMAGLAGSGLPLSLDQSGRLVSLFALIACTWPLWVSLRRFGASPQLAAIAGILFLVAPIHVFWGRAVMIESLALLFAMGFTAVIQTMVATRAHSLAWVATILGTAAALVKVTTFFTFAVLCGAVVAVAIVADLRTRNVRGAAAMALAAGLPVAVALAALLFWLDVSDTAKASSSLTAWLGSDQLSSWNYGTLSQRTSKEFWVETVLARVLPDVWGLSIWLAPALLVAGCLSRDKRQLLPWLLACIGLFLLPMLVFTNVHRIHNYYQFANAVFLVVLLATWVDIASRDRREWVAPVLTLLCAAGMVAHGVGHFLPDMIKDTSNHRAVQLARVIRANVAPDDVLITAGLDWSATVPYYAQRRAVMLLRESDMQRIPEPLATRENPQGANVGALVQCGPGYEFLDRLAVRLGPEPVRVQAGGCIVTLRKRP